MNPNLYTEKAWDAIAKLPQYADKYSTQYVEATHVLRALLDEGADGLAQRIIFKAGGDGKMLEKNLEEHFSKQPKISDTTNKAMGKSMTDCLTKANSFKRELGDQYISIEHFMLAMSDIDGITKKLFSNVGLSPVSYTHLTLPTNREV